MGTKQAIFFPFLISCTRAHFRMAELGCLASIPLQEIFTQGEDLDGAANPPISNDLHLLQHNALGVRAPSERLLVLATHRYCRT